jgi:hypothetical protein
MALHFGASLRGERMGDFDGQAWLGDLPNETIERLELKSFFDMILPATIKFLPDYYHFGDRYGSAWACKDYPPGTEEQALLAQLAVRPGVTLHIYNRLVDAMDQRRILQNATRKNRFAAKGSDVHESVTAEGNLQDVVSLVANLRRNREPLLHCAVFLELRADSQERLKNLQQDVLMELSRVKISPERLLLRQQRGELLPAKLLRQDRPPGDFILVKTPLAAAFGWILTAARRTKPTRIASFYATPGRAKAT